MARKVRVVLLDARYHSMSHGDRREDIFLDDALTQRQLKQEVIVC